MKKTKEEFREILEGKLDTYQVKLSGKSIVSAFKKFDIDVIIEKEYCMKAGYRKIQEETHFYYFDTFNNERKIIGKTPLDCAFQYYKEHFFYFGD